jgi:hypothetical protein
VGHKLATTGREPRKTAVDPTADGSRFFCIPAGELYGASTRAQA